jgi:predicted amidophosphoribosyltransferase
VVCDTCIGRFTATPHRATTSRGVPFVALGPYRGGLRALILAAKHRRAHAAIRRLGGALRDAVLPWGNVIAIPVPSSRPGFLARGYGLASTIARAAELTVANCLLMDDHGTQRGRHRTERRRRNIRVGSRQPEIGSRVVIVDDVMTTGASIDAATDACVTAGLRVVGVLVVAIAEQRTTAPFTEYRSGGGAPSAW